MNYYFEPSTATEAGKEKNGNPPASLTGRSDSIENEEEKKKEGATTTTTTNPAKKGWSGWEEDSVVEQGGLKVVVASDALFYVIGTVMDYIVTNVEEKFIFRNPNKKYGCGCEESFMPYDSEDLEED